MLRNQATALLRHEHLTTTVPRAKELRPFVERLITIAKRGLAGGDANGKALNARRLVMQDLQDREVVTKLFDTLAPRFRHGPAATRACCASASAEATRAEVAQVELVGSEFNPRAKAEAEAKKAEAAAEGEGRRRPAAGGGRTAARQEGRGPTADEKASKPAKRAVDERRPRRKERQRVREAQVEDCQVEIARLGTSSS